MYSTAGLGVSAHAGWQSRCRSPWEEVAQAVDAALASTKLFISEVLGLLQCCLSCRGASCPAGGNCSGSCEKGGMPGCPLHLWHRATFALLRLSLLVLPSVPRCLLAGHPFLHILTWLPRAGAAPTSPQGPAETTWGGFLCLPAEKLGFKPCKTSAGILEMAELEG